VLPGTDCDEGAHLSAGITAQARGIDSLTESRGYTWVRCTLRPAGLRAHRCERSSGNSVLCVVPGYPQSGSPPSSYPGALPFGWAHDEARSRGRTSTGELQSIHGILSGTFFLS
jgi:hypothetical protein